MSSSKSPANAELSFAPTLLSGRVAIVTGAASGQGLAEAHLLAACGAKVVMTDLADSIEAAAVGVPGAYSFRHDVAEEDDWTTVVSEVLKREGRIDVLINNAGIPAPGGLLTTDLEQYRRVIAVNQTGALLGMRAVAPAMIEARSGSIVNVSSTAGLTGTRNILSYSAAKWALRGLTKSVALELAEYGIRVNALCPGRVDTPLLTDAGRFDPEMARKVPLARIGQPAEVARLAVFLASDLSSFCTGADFTIDGGQSAFLP